MFNELVDLFFDHFIAIFYDLHPVALGVLDQLVGHELAEVGGGVDRENHVDSGPMKFGDLHEGLVGPFFVFEHAELENQRYRGGLSSADVTLAVGNSGDTQIELIVCENQAPSVYKEFIDAGKSGVHHVGLMPTDYKATCLQFQSLGFDVAFECSIGGTDLVYFDTVDALGHFTEFWDNSDAFRDFQRFVKHAAQHWDGSDPIRTGDL